MLYVGDELLDSTPEIIIALYANLDVNLQNIYIHIYTHIYMYVCVYMYIYTQNKYS